VLSKARILDHVWQYDFDGDGSVVETYISYLRKKVDHIEPRLIRTVRGFGYSIREPEPARSMTPRERPRCADVSRARTRSRR
jgi:DNA-binding winged helix-turn-helix (wHTH) protein